MCCIDMSKAAMSSGPLLAHVDSLILVFKAPQRTRFFILALKNQMLHSLQQDSYIGSASPDCMANMYVCQICEFVHKSLLSSLRQTCRHQIWLIA